MRSTHGFVAHTEDGEVSREIGIHLREDRAFGIRIQTIWKLEAEPVVTQVRLTAKAFAMLHDAMYEAAHNMHAYPMKETT